MPYRDLTRITASAIVKNPNYDRYHRGPASVVYKFFDKRLLVVLLRLHSERLKLREIQPLLKLKICQTKN